MKSNRLIMTIGAAWVLFIALDSFSGILRAWYLRKMSNPFRSFYHVVKYLRATAIFFISILNLWLIAGSPERRARQ
jgi:hypothetical protein